MRQCVEHLAVADGLQLERRLLAAVARGGVGTNLLFWRPTDTALVAPRNLLRGRSAVDLGRQLGCPVVMRDSGGDVVPQTPTVLNIAVMFAAQEPHARLLSIESAYDVLCRPLVAWLRDMGLAAGVGAVSGAFCDGRFNITVDGRKLAGTAQRWRHLASGGRAVLAHAAVLVDADLEQAIRTTNDFYGAIGSSKRCDGASHITLQSALGKAGGATVDLSSRLPRLHSRYRGCLSEWIQGERN